MSVHIDSMLNETSFIYNNKIVDLSNDFNW